MCFSIFGRTAEQIYVHNITREFLTLCQLGMDEYTASKLSILAYSGSTESRDKIVEFKTNKRKEQCWKFNYKPINH